MHFLYVMLICGASRSFIIPAGGKLLSRPLYRTAITAEIERKFVFNNAILEYCKLNAVGMREIFMKDVYFDNANVDLTTRDMWLRQRNEKLELKWPMVLDAANKQHQKVDLPSSSLTGLDFYQESTDVAQISKAIQGLAGVSVDFDRSKYTIEEKVDLLKVAGIKPFGTILTHRTRHSLCMDLPDHLRSSSNELNSKINMFVDIDVVKYVLPESARLEPTSAESPRDTYEIGEIEFDFSTLHTDVAPNENASLGSAEQRAHEDIMQHVFDVIGIKPAPVRGKVLEYLVRFRPAHFEALRKSGQLASKGL